ncbi:hypothetical protein FZC76_14455 [Sutcliffiella horikoshii]|uniref:DUF4179 domain-containing protein n=1 Tax=Sutcliffiella horikoshii TaxID=79883 RepID=A0A5D4SWK9_9BACI|nr:hypothetical protein [Sutcliffiella horikoshii]TYS67760.1 hypothetical protein FZC76_14455 [Sutcliffiella horikoshii]
MKQSNDFQALNQKIVMSDKERERVQEQVNSRMNVMPESVEKKASTPRKYYVALGAATLIFMLILIPAIFNNLERSSDSAVVANETWEEKVADLLIEHDDYEILHIEEVDSGAMVLFTYQIKKEVNIEMVSAMFISNINQGREDITDGGEHAIIDQSHISHEFISPINEDSPFPLVFGKIISSDVSEVLLKKVETKQEVKTEKIMSKSGERYWFAFTDIKPDEMFELHGLTRDGQIIYSIDTLYANGNSPVLVEGNPEAANFELTAEELDVYQQLKMGFNQQLLLDLSPISIAKLFVQATSDKEWELQYELYTDREDVRRIEKEEYFREMVIPDKDVLFGIQDGTFHDHGDSYGHISYTNIYGQEWAFQMVKENDGSWAVAFIPLQ